MTRKAKVSVYLPLLVVPVGIVTVGLASRANQPHQLKTVDLTRATDPAYRDGLYLGRLDGQEGRKAQSSVGRWNNEKDRASFVAGYQEGYREAMSESIPGHHE